MPKVILVKDITVDEHVDILENLAIERAKLFDCNFANVQPHFVLKLWSSLFSFIKPGDTTLAMSLNSRGHLTHEPTLPQVWFNALHYEEQKPSNRL